MSRDRRGTRGHHFRIEPPVRGDNGPHLSPGFGPAAAGVEARDLGGSAPRRRRYCFSGAKMSALASALADHGTADPPEKGAPRFEPSKRGEKNGGRRSQNRGPHASILKLVPQQPNTKTTDAASVGEVPRTFLA